MSAETLSTTGYEANTIPPQKKTFSFLKGGSKTPDTPVVRTFHPSRERYVGSNELVEEFRGFVGKDLKAGEVVQIEHNDAFRMSATPSEVKAKLHAINAELEDGIQAKRAETREAIDRFFQFDLGIGLMSLAL